MAVSIAVILIGVSVYYFYSAEQAQIRGFAFGQELQFIQEQIHDEQTRFISSIAEWEEGTISDEKMIGIGEDHIKKFQTLLDDYNDLQPPDAFARSVKLFKLSLEYQIESHEHRVDWIKSGDELELVRFQELTQLAFEAEQAGLKSFNDAKAGIQQ